MSRLLAAFSLLVVLAGCSSTGKFIRYGVPDIKDVERFPAAIIEKSDEAFEFAQVPNHHLPPPQLWYVNNRNSKESVPAYMTAESFLEENHCTAFLVIRNDTIIYENYFNGYTADRLSTNFSVTKATTSTLIGMAIDDGYIKDVHQPVSDFLPFYKDKGREGITIYHLLNMTSGLAENDYKTIGKLVNLYYTSNQEKVVRKVGMKHDPGTHFAYKSLSTQVLGEVLEAATGEPVYDYLQRKMWSPMGMEFDAKYTLDREGGDAKMYGGLAASARDLAKIGRLMLHEGEWNGEQLISADWTAELSKRDTIQGAAWKYKYCWWQDTYPGEAEDSKEKVDYFAGGFRGQVIYVNPVNNMIVIRLGLKESNMRWPHCVSKLTELPIYLNEPKEDEPIYADIDGQYKSKKGKKMSLKMHDNHLFVGGSEGQEPMEFEQETKFSFVNRKNKSKIILDYRDMHVCRVIVEEADGTTFFVKNNQQ